MFIKGMFMTVVMRKWFMLILHINYCFKFFVDVHSYHFRAFIEIIDDDDFPEDDDVDNDDG